MVKNPTTGEEAPKPKLPLRGLLINLYVKKQPEKATPTLFFRSQVDAEFFSDIIFSNFGDDFAKTLSLAGPVWGASKTKYAIEIGLPIESIKELIINLKQLEQIDIYAAGKPTPWRTGGDTIDSVIKQWEASLKGKGRKR